MTWFCLNGVLFFEKEPSTGNYHNAGDNAEGTTTLSLFLIHQVASRFLSQRKKEKTNQLGCIRRIYCVCSSSFNFSDFWSDKPITLVEVSPSSLNEQGPYHCILLRLTEALATKDELIINQFETYLQENPETKVVDSISGQLAAVDRRTMSEATRILNLNPGKFHSFSFLSPSFCFFCSFFLYFSCVLSFLFSVFFCSNKRKVFFFLFFLYGILISHTTTEKFFFSFSFLFFLLILCRFVFL